MRINGLVMTALIALSVVIAYDKYGKSVSLKRAA